MADLIGVVFRPDGVPALCLRPCRPVQQSQRQSRRVWGARVADCASGCANCPVPPSDCSAWKASSRMRLPPAWPAAAPASLRRGSMLCGVLPTRPRWLTVRDVARSTGWSERRFSQVFREQVGLSPKVWCRVQRFQRAVKQLHAGVDVPWAKLALDCGYYDQSHFANEFRAFSGVDVTTYSANRTHLGEPYRRTYRLELYCGSPAWPPRNFRFFQASQPPRLSCSTASTRGGSMPNSSIMPSLRYKDAPAAIDWLCQVSASRATRFTPRPTALSRTPN